MIAVFFQICSTFVKVGELKIAHEIVSHSADSSAHLALMGDKRVIINNGAMQKVIEPSSEERANLTELRALDAKLMGLRHRLRMGERLDQI